MFHGEKRGIETSARKVLKYLRKRIDSSPEIFRSPARDDFLHCNQNVTKHIRMNLKGAENIAKDRTIRPIEI